MKHTNETHNCLVGAFALVLSRLHVHQQSHPELVAPLTSAACALSDLIVAFKNAQTSYDPLTVVKDPRVEVREFERMIFKTGFPVELKQ